MKPRHEVTRWRSRSPVRRLDRSPDPPPPLLPATDGREEGRRGTAVVVPPAARSGKPALGSGEPAPGSSEPAPGSSENSSLPPVAPHRRDMGGGRGSAAAGGLSAAAGRGGDGRSRRPKPPLPPWGSAHRSLQRRRGREAGGDAGEMGSSRRREGLGGERVSPATSLGREGVSSAGGLGEEGVPMVSAENTRRLERESKKRMGRG